MNRYTTWLRTAAIFQVINLIIHIPSFFISPAPKNETERQLFTLMDTYKLDLGAGFHRTMTELTLVFSACLALLCLLSGSLNLYLLKKRIEPEVMKGVIVINLLVFGILLVLTMVFAFILPIVSIGLVVVFLLMALLAANRSS